MTFNNSTTQGEIKPIIDLIDNLDSAPYFTLPLRKGTREFMGALLNAYGVTDSDTHRLINDKDLIELYVTARGSVAAGARVADQIRRKYGDNPILGPVTLKEPVIPDPGNYPSPRDPGKYPDSHTQTLPAPLDKNGEYATKLFVRDHVASAKGDLQIDFRARLSDMKSHAEEIRRNVHDTLLAVTDALPSVVKGHVADALKALTPVTLNVVVPNAEPVALGMVHRSTPQLLKMLAAGVNVYLHGPAGSGKTTAGRKCAEAFGLQFYFAAKVESEYMLLGFKDARGETVRTQFREAYEHGGVFLFDELDGSSPSAVVALNAALANGICPFPDGIIMRHSNFKCIAAGNTKLGGASRQYVGRNQLDAASVDRFAFLEWSYDDALEAALATNSKWCEYVQAAREAVAKRALPHLITPRATYDGCKLLEAGIPWDEVDDALVWKGLDSTTVDQVVRSMDSKFLDYANEHDALCNVSIL